jgi:hypothetical protein
MYLYCYIYIYTHTLSHDKWHVYIYMYIFIYIYCIAHVYYCIAHVYTCYTHSHARTHKHKNKTYPHIYIHTVHLQPGVYGGEMNTNIDLLLVNGTRISITIDPYTTGDGTFGSYIRDSGIAITTDDRCVLSGLCMYVCM